MGAGKVKSKSKSSVLQVPYPAELDAGKAGGVLGSAILTIYTCFVHHDETFISFSKSFS